MKKSKELFNDFYHMLSETLVKEEKVLQFYKENKKNFNPSWKSNECLLIAYRNDFFKLGRLLIKDKRTDPSVKDYAIIDILLAKKNKRELIFYLKNKRIPPLCNNGRGIYSLIILQDFKTVNYLLDLADNENYNIKPILCTLVKNSLNYENYKVCDILYKRYSHDLKGHSNKLCKLFYNKDIKRLFKYGSFKEGLSLELVF